MSLHWLLLELEPTSMSSQAQSNERAAYCSMASAGMLCNNICPIWLCHACSSSLQPVTMMPSTCLPTLGGMHPLEH